MPTLAINGGEPVAPDGLETTWPIFANQEREALIDVLEGGRWCSAGYLFAGEETSAVAEFERTFSSYIGTEYATAVPNGTQALQLAFRSIGLEPGDEVIVPAVTFVASASAVVLANGVPVFVDVDPETYQLDPDAVEAAITDRTKAIEVVHYGGYPADMDRLVEIADSHDLYLIEDAAEAHGTEWRGEKVGSLGDIGCFSLQQGKPLTCGEGGVLTYDDHDLADEIYAHTRIGRSREGDTYEHVVPAGNYRLSEFLGALLLAQFSRFEEQTDRRDANGRYFAEQLEEIKGLSGLKPDSRITTRGYYFVFVRFDAEAWEGIDRDRFLEALQAEGVGGHTAHNEPLYRLEAFAEIDSRYLHGHDVDYTMVECPVAERIYAEEVIAFSKDVLLERGNVDAILEAFHKLADNRDALR